MDKAIEKNMKFDFVIQNPPYSGSLHLEFLKKGLELLNKEKGKMTIIEPATWLINLRKNGKAKKYDEIKKMLKGHVSRVIIENLNGEFNISNTVPFSIVYIDFSKVFDRIEFICSGETKYVKSLDDCNHIGNREIINSIFKKISQYDKIKNHITSIQQNKDIYYLQLTDIVYAVCGVYFVRNSYFTRDTAWDSHKCGQFFRTFTSPTKNSVNNEITNIIPKKAARGGSTAGKVKLTDNPATCVFGTKSEIENYKYYVSNNKLPLFLNICLTIDQNNNSKEFIPWLVDKQYTNEEINKLFNFSTEEISLIDKTIKKFERNSPWFKRYMCGKDSVSDEEVQKFIDNL